jgi:hypothetical protein
MIELSVRNQIKSLDNNQVIDLAVTKGSPYLNEIFAPGTVYVASSDQNLGYQMRYNIYNDRIEVENDNTIYALIKDSDYSYKILDRTFVYLGFKNRNEVLRKGYFQKLTNGKVSLLLRYTCNYEPEKVGKPPVFKVTPARFTVKKSYYIMVDDQLTSISTNKKKLLEAFGSYKTKVKSYINSNKLKPGNERDLIRIITYYNSLLEK